MKELANYLQLERTNRNISLQAISGQSGISMSMLKALEAGDLERFGALLLAREVIRGYCAAIDIDPQYVFQTYAAEIEACDLQRRGIIRFGQQMKVLHKKRRMISFPLFLLTLATIGIFYGGSWISEKRAKLYAPPPVDQISTQEDLPDELQQKLAPPVPPDLGKKEQRPMLEARREEPVKPAAPAPEADPAAKDTEKTVQRAENSIREAERTITEARHGGSITTNDIAAVPVPAPQATVALSNSMEVMAEDRPASAVEDRKVLKFAVEADDRTWIQVKIDEKTTRSAMLAAGDKREWSAEKGIQVVVGNAGGIRMKFNDQPINAPRDPGKVLRFRLPEYVRNEG